MLQLFARAVAGHSRVRPQFFCATHVRPLAKISSPSPGTLERDRIALRSLVDSSLRKSLGGFQQELAGLDNMWKRKHTRFDDEYLTLGEEVERSVKPRKGGKGSTGAVAEVPPVGAVRNSEEDVYDDEQLEDRLASQSRTWKEAVDMEAARFNSKGGRPKLEVFSQDYPATVIQMEKEEINTLPHHSFSGQIVEVSTAAQVPAAMRLLGREKVIGFDTETRPVFSKGHPQRPICLLQMATASHCVLFRVNKLKRIPKALQLLLEDPSVTKVAHSSVAEIREMSRQYNIQCRNFVDIFEMGKDMGARPLNLRALCGLFLGYRISKDCQVSNWERDVLEPRQQVYAATDAWVSREVFFAMLRHLSRKKYQQYSMSEITTSDEETVADAAVQTDSMRPAEGGDTKAMMDHAVMLQQLKKQPKFLYQPGCALWMYCSLTGTGGPVYEVSGTSADAVAKLYVPILEKTFEASGCKSIRAAKTHAASLAIGEILHQAGLE